MRGAILFLIVIIAIQSQPVALLQGNRNYEMNFNDKVNLYLQSGSKRSYISCVKSCSCQLAVFAYQNDQFKVQIESIDDSITYIILCLKHLNYSRLLYVTNNAATDTINASNYRIEHNEVTQYIKIQAYAINNNTHSLLFTQERKVYLIKISQDNQNYTYVINLPQTAIMITQLAAMIAVILLSLNIKYRKFTPFNFGFPFAVFYSVFLFVTVYLQIFQAETAQIAKWIVMIFSLVCIYFYMQDIYSIFIQKSVIIIVVSLLSSIAILAVDLFILEDTWYINNIIALLVAGSLIKFIVIRKLKASALPLGLLWLFFILRQCGMLFRLQDFQHTMQIKIVPLFLQIPALLNDDPDGYICSAFGTSKIITIGLILNYAVRVDLFLSSHFYKICTIIVAVVCLLFQLGCSFLFDELPVMEYISVIAFFPIVFALILLFASKRGEWAEIWHGSFHDMAVNRNSIKKEHKEDDSLDRVDESFGSLKLDYSQITDDN